MSYRGVAYSRVRPTRVWRTLEYATTKEECTLESKSDGSYTGTPYRRVYRHKMYVSPVSYIEPCFLLSSLRLVFHIGFSLYLTLLSQQLSQSRSLLIKCSWLPLTRVNCIIIILY